MEKEKRICPNCGKELTLSARKCKYCDTALIIPTKNKINLKVLIFVLIFIIFICFFATKLVTIGQVNLENIIISLLPYIVGALVICVIGALAGNRICQVISILFISCAVICFLIDYWQQVLIGLGFLLLLAVSAIGNNKSGGNVRDTGNNEYHDFRRGKYGKYGGADMNPNVYAIIRYKSTTPSTTPRLFYEFKCYAYHIKDAPSTIWVKGISSPCTADYDSYQIISSNEYLNSNLPDDYNYYNK